MSETVNVAALLGQATPCFIDNLYIDSRQVTPRSGFVLVKPEQKNAMDHVHDALARGAVALLTESLPTAIRASLPASIRVIEVPQLTARLGELADQFYQSPSTKLHITGMTGTNGKTTTMWLHAQVMQALYIGTVGVGVLPKVSPATHTTADVFTLNRILHGYVKAGVRQASVEVSSHALDQGRTANIAMPVVGFSNLTRDHLDYHPSMEHYFASKCKILQSRGVHTAVLNGDDAWVEQSASNLPANVKILWVGRDVYHGARFVRVESAIARDNGLHLKGQTHAGPFSLSSSLIGQFNVDNLVMVMGLCLAQDLELQTIVQALSAAYAPPGRMEVFKGQGATIVVDYAHTPDALEKALAAVAAHARGQIYCVMGCGGDRDRGKRSLMGQVAEAHADLIVLTDDNPRNEDPDAIIKDIQAGMSGLKPTTVLRNRAEAIAWAYSNASAGDWVLVAGKGHEDYQIIGAQRLAYSDRELAKDLVKEAA